MPTVLRRGGFSVLVRLPPREHGPPHVHVQAGGAECEFWIGRSAVRVKAIHSMTDRDVRAALAIVAAHARFLLSEWTRLHGDEDPQRDRP